MIREPELDLKHAANSARLIYDIRVVLNSSTEFNRDWAKEIGSLIDRIDEILAKTPIAHVSFEWKVMIAGFRVLLGQVNSVAIAEGGEGDLTIEREKRDVLFGEMKRLVTSNAGLLPISTKSSWQSLLNAGTVDSDRLREFLSMVPLSTLYWQTREFDLPDRNAFKGTEAKPKPIVRVVVFLDNAPIASPQLLRPNILYPLKFRVHGVTWPVDGKRLRLDLMTTLPQEEFSLSEYTLDAPSCIKNGEYQGELAGYIKFNSAQSSMLDDLAFTVRGAFDTPDGHPIEVPVIGHNELRLKIVDEVSHPLMTGNRRLDRHVAELISTLISDCPEVRAELPSLLVMLHALTGLLSTYAQEAVFKGRSDVSESEFQTKVTGDLRRQLGPDVQEHPHQAGGIPDIRFRGVIVELKVEKENGNRNHIAKKYAAQAVQYASPEARQVSILLVLDLTEKENPPGDIRNDIMLTDVPTHGTVDSAEKFPSKAFVFVINGNMKNPSSYSA